MISSSLLLNDSKKAQLLLDYKILSSLKKQKAPQTKSTKSSDSHPQTQSNICLQTISNPNHISLLSSCNLYNLPSKDTNPDKLLTNNSFYHNDFMNFNSKHISMLSFDNKDYKNTSDSFYKNFLPSYQIPTSLNFNSKFTQEFLQQKREIEFERNDIIQKDSPETNNKNEGIIAKKKPNIFIHHKYEKKNSKNDSSYHFKCLHPICDFVSQTKKQKMFHHNKMNNECKNDTINILKLIREAKEIIVANSNKSHLSNKQKKTIKKIKERFESVIKSLSLNDYAQFIVGLDFDDNSN